MDELVEKLIQDGYLKTPLIIEAFKKIDRRDFVIDEFKDCAYINEPLQIGYGQTISQPLTVAFMLELLQPISGEKILDIGSGSGWQTSLLTYCVQPNGKVYAIERIPELVEFGRKNIAKYNFFEKGIVELICGDGSKGYANMVTRPELVEGFDKIICAASAEEIPQEWKKQLKIGGRIVAPVKNSIWLIIKKSHLPAGRRGDDFEEQEFPGFAFVPLV